MREPITIVIHKMNLITRLLRFAEVDQASLRHGLRYAGEQPLSPDDRQLREFATMLELAQGALLSRKLGVERDPNHTNRALNELADYLGVTCEKHPEWCKSHAPRSRWPLGLFSPSAEEAFGQLRDSIRQYLSVPDRSDSDRGAKATKELYGTLESWCLRFSEVL